MKQRVMLDITANATAGLPAHSRHTFVTFLSRVRILESLGHYVVTIT